MAMVNLWYFCTMLPRRRNFISESCESQQGRTTFSFRLTEVKLYDIIVCFYLIWVTIQDFSSPQATRPFICNRRKMIEALIFDFDGLILDTEISAYQTWQEIYREYACDLPFSTWASCIGGSPELFDPCEYMEEQIGRPL